MNGSRQMGQSFVSVIATADRPFLKKSSLEANGTEALSRDDMLMCGQIPGELGRDVEIKVVWSKSGVASPRPVLGEAVKVKSTEH